MNTAQVSIELVLAGILALCAFVLPFWTGSEISEKILQGNAVIGMLGLAYLLGVVFDKLSDTILGPFEKFKRLRIAGEHMTKHPRAKGDPFPQNVLEFRLRKANDGRLEWMDSLKSRIRTSRELAVLGLPATAGIAMYSSLSNKCTGSDPCTAHWLYLFVVVNIILFLTATRNTSTTSKIPKTDQLASDADTRTIQLAEAEKRMNVELRVYYLILVNSGIALLITTLLSRMNWQIAVFGLTGAVTTLLGLWTWHNITGTYLKFVAREMPNLRKEKE